LLATLVLAGCSAEQQELHVVSRCNRRSTSSFGQVMASEFRFIAALCGSGGRHRAIS
jgi:uncharacterized lipoprotein YajG